MSETAGSLKSAVNELETASKQHETDLVVELGSDRLGKWSGAVILALAGVSKLSDVISENILCYPRNSTEGYDGEFITFAKAYCWESITSDGTLEDGVCGANQTSSAENDILVGQEPYMWKLLVQWMFYFMLLQALTFAVPGAYWHMRVGARLMGHVKFMQLFLQEIYEQMKSIPQGWYLNQAYDEDSSNFDGLCTYEEEKARESGGSELTAVTTATQGKGDAVETKVIVKEGNDGLSCLDWLLCGRLKDRHLFSMICYENFAQIHELPYILSVQKLHKTQERLEPKPCDVMPVNKAMMYLWCHPDNFHNIFLVRLYILKHLFIAVVACVFLGVMGAVLPTALRISSSSGNFPCDLTDFDLCLSCTVQRKDDFLAFFLVDMVITTFVLIQTLATLVTMRNSCPDLNTAHFFDTLMETSNMAFTVAELYNKPVPEDSQLKQALNSKIAECFADELVKKADFTKKIEENMKNVDTNAGKRFVKRQLTAFFKEVTPQ